MPVSERRDVLWMAGVTAAVGIVIAAAVVGLFLFARAGSTNGWLAVPPALLLLSGLYLVRDLGRRREVDRAATTAESARLEAERRARELERLISFGHALSRSLEHDSIRAAVQQHLPRLAGTDHIWVLLRQGSHWEALAGDTRGAEEVIEQENLAERLLGEPVADSDTGRHIGFPLVVGGTPIGVLGVKATERPLESWRHRALEAAAALLAVSLKNAQLFREVRENSLRDALTGCFTRAHAIDVVDAELRRARRAQTPVTLIMFDLDHFKEINDAFGHLCGDAVLAEVGRRMFDVLRGSDLKCRYGGEEFLVLLPETALQFAGRVAETLRREIADRPIPWAGEPLTVTASFGLAQALPGEINVEALVSRADAALYRAKQDGRNCVRVASEPISIAPADHQTPASERTPRVAG